MRTRSSFQDSPLPALLEPRGTDEFRALPRSAPEARARTLVAASLDAAVWVRETLALQRLRGTPRA